MKPQVLATVVLAAIAGVSFGLLGVGAVPGTPLCAAGCSPAITQTNGGYSDLQMAVSLSSFASPSGYYVSAYLPNGSSSPIGIGLNVWTNASTSSYCDANPGLAGGAAWAGGKGYSSAYFVVFVTTSSGAVESIGQGGGPNYIVVSENSSAVQYAGCLTGLYSSGGTFASATGSATFYPSTVYLPGNYTDNSVLHVRFYTTESNCYYVFVTAGGSPDRACQAVSGHVSSFALSPDSIGTKSIAIEAQAVLHSGFSQLFPPTQSEVVNGGQMTIPYTTGWTDGSGFAIQFETPSARGAQTTLQTIAVPDNAVSSATFNVPAAASQAPPQPCAVAGSTDCNWNIYTVVLFSDKFAEAVQSINVLIYANSAPSNVSIAATDTSGHSPIEEGDTVSLTVSALATNASGAVTTITLSGYWNLGESTPPVNSQYWLFTNPAGKGLTLTTVGNVTSGTISTQVNNVAPLTVIANVCTAKAQCQSAVITLNIAPANCATNGFCKGPPTFLQTWGVLLLGMGLIAVTLIAVVWAPGYLRYAAILVVVGEGVVFAVFWHAIATVL